MGEAILPAANERAVGFFDSDQGKLWSRWKITGGRYLPPDPERFNEISGGILRSERKAVVRAVLDYGLEQSGLIKSPKDLSEPLEQLTLGTDEVYDERVLLEFLQYCETMDQLDNSIREADSFLDSLNFTQRFRNLEFLTTGCNYSRVPAMRIIDGMYKSKDERFRLVSDGIRKDSQAIIRILYCQQLGIDLNELLASSRDGR